MKKGIYFLFFGLSLLFSGCYNDNVRLVDFSNVDAGEGTFHVLSQQTTDMENIQWSAAQQELFTQASALPQNTADSLPAPMRASSTNMNAIVQQLADWGNGKKAIELAGTYSSVDTEGNPITLSGKVILPADGKFKRYILVSHYTPPPSMISWRESRWAPDLWGNGYEGNAGSGKGRQISNRQPDGA